MQKCRPSKAELELAYHLEPSRTVLAQRYGVRPETIQSWLKFYKIPRRTRSEAMRAVYAQHPEYLEYRHSREFKASCSSGWLWHTGVIRRKPHSLAHRKKLSIAHKETLRNNPELLQVLQQNLRKACQRAREVSQDPVRDRERVSKILRATRRRPTSLEQRLISIISRYDLPYKYTGDGSFILAGLNPDFINTNGAKIALETFGNYWHIDKAEQPYSTEEGRKAIFAEYGWDLIVLWESELKHLTGQQIVERLSESQNKDKEVLCLR